MKNNTISMNINENFVLLVCFVDKLYRLPKMPKKINVKNPKISRIDAQKLSIFEIVLRPKNFASFDNELINPLVIDSKKG